MSKYWPVEREYFLSLISLNVTTFEMSSSSFCCLNVLMIFSISKFQSSVPADLQSAGYEYKDLLSANYYLFNVSSFHSFGLRII